MPIFSIERKTRKSQIRRWRLHTIDRERENMREMGKRRKYKEITRETISMFII